MSSPLEAIEFGQHASLQEPQSVAARLEASLQCHAGRTALVADERSVDYGELDRRTAEIARTIAARSAPETLVPILSGGGIDYCLAIVACLRAGRPFVPLDVSWPDGRLTEALEHLDSDLMINTESTFPGRATASVPALCVTAEPAATAPRPQATARSTRPAAAASSLAYGFFTSGTTGKPKCALNLHTGLVNRIDYMTGRFGGRCTTLVNSSHVFDSSLWQILWPLCSGGTVAIPKRDGPLDLAGTLASIGRWQVEMTDFVPSIFEALVRHIERDRDACTGQLASLQAVIIGGEEADARVVERFKAALPEVEVVNTYGPTEAAIGSVFHRIDANERDAVPLGRPIDNTFVAITDDAGRIAARGCIGQIAVGGLCLGRGYLRDKPQTDRAFRRIASATNGKSYAAYLTGDLGHIDDSGLLWFHGRVDDQLKVGGVRIEPAEIENHLSGHPDIEAARVVGIEGPGGRTRIAAFYRSQRTISDLRLKAFLSEALPREWIPTLFRRLEAFPLTHNGKLDRAALRQLVVDRSTAQPAAPPFPEDTPEEAILAAWRQCFDDASIEPDSDFFRLGGDSLMAVHLGLQLEESLGRRIPAKAIYDARTPRGLAQAIAAPQQDSIPGDRAGSGDAVLRDLDVFKRIGVGQQLSADRVCEVMVTGATGYVGAHVVAELLSQPQFHVICPLRAADASEARWRLYKALSATGLTPDAAIKQRLEVLPSDVAQQRFGLPSALWHRLSTRVQAVVHAAAEVDFVKPYDSLRGPNVRGLLHALELCTQGPLKRLIFVSTISVAGAGVGRNVKIPESLISREWPRPDSGYDLTKWVCEGGLDPLVARGLPVKVFRLGEMMPPPQGSFNPRSQVAILLEGCTAIGAYPRIATEFDWTPVDYFAKVTAHCLCQPTFAPQVTNFISPISVDFEELIEIGGLRRHLQALPFEAFLERLRGAFRETPRQPAIGRSLSLMERMPRGPGRKRPSAAFQTASARTFLDRLELTWTEPSRVSHARSFEHLTQSADRASFQVTGGTRRAAPAQEEITTYGTD